MYLQLTRNIDQFIRHQLDQYTFIPREKQKKVRPVITISREFGCEGFPVAKLLSEHLKNKDGNEWLIYNRKLIDEVTEVEEFDKELLESLSEQQRSQVDQYVDHVLAHKPSNYSLYKEMATSIKALAEQGNCIIVGSGAAILTSDHSHALHIRLKASLNFRVERIKHALSLSREEALKVTQEKDDSRYEMVQTFTQQNVNDPGFYDIIIDNERFSAEQIVDLIETALQHRIPDWLK